MRKFSTIFYLHVMISHLPYTYSSGALLTTSSISINFTNWLHFYAYDLETEPIHWTLVYGIYRHSSERRLHWNQSNAIKISANYLRCTKCIDIRRRGAVIISERFNNVPSHRQVYTHFPRLFHFQPSDLYTANGLLHGIVNWGLFSPFRMVIITLLRT